MGERIGIKFIEPASLEPATIDELFALASRYLELDRSWFEQRLRDCDQVLLYQDSTGRVYGSTTLDLIDLTHEGTRVRVLYTGCVVLDEAVRGRGLIQRAGALSFLRYGLSTRRRMYWFSDCDSFRAYLLSLNFERGWPRREVEPPGFEGGLYEVLCQQVFASTFDPTMGVCARIPERVLKRHAAEIPTQLQLTHADVAFFVERNPKYVLGEALPVLVPLDRHNWWSLAKRLARTQRRLAQRPRARATNSVSIAPAWR